MADKNWFLHVSGEAIGPLSTSQMTKMLTTNHCNAGDYVWCDGMSGWTRVADCDEFTSSLPAQPRIATPKGSKTTAPQAEETPAPKPVAKAPKAAPAPKVVAKAPEPKPEPEPEPVVEPERATHAAIDGKAKINGSLNAKLIDISESGVVFEKVSGLESGADVKMKIESPSLSKPLEVTGVVVDDTTFEGKPAMTVEFTRMNPAYKRVIATYIAGTQGQKKAA